MSRNKKLIQWMKYNIPKLSIAINAIKDAIPALLKNTLEVL